MQTSMTGRPRPVTATVTKPRWMQIPDPDAMAKIRRRSVESTGSTASLTSLLDHDSYVSENESKTEDLDETYSLKNPTVGEKVKRKVHSAGSKKPTPESMDSNTRTLSHSKPKSSNTSLSAWEQWIVQKAKDDRKKLQAEKQKKRDQKAEKERLEQEKQQNMKKAESVIQKWIEKKEQERKEKRKAEKEILKEKKDEKDAKEAQYKEKREEALDKWVKLKRNEEEKRRQIIKKKNDEIQRKRQEKKEAAEKSFQDWLKEAHNRPKTAPNSFGYLSGKMTGYHDRTAYPNPSFFNPIPWHPPAVPPATEKSDKSRKTKATKPYKWNPEKYF